MHTFEAIRSRRAIKHYDPTYRISSEEEDQLLDLAMQAPSSFNIQHWRLVNISDPELRKSVRAAAFDQAQVTEASLLYILTADVQAWAKEPARYWRNAPQAVKDMILPWISGFYTNNPQAQRDEALRSVGLFAQTLMLAAKAMGYDSCPMIGFDAAKVSELIRLPKDHIIGMMIVVGKGTKPAYAKPGFIDKQRLLTYNHF